MRWTTESLPEPEGPEMTMRRGNGEAPAPAASPACSTEGRSGTGGCVVIHAPCLRANFACIGPPSIMWRNRRDDHADL